MTHCIGTFERSAEGRDQVLLPICPLIKARVRELALGVVPVRRLVSSRGAGMNVSEATSYSDTAYPHLPLSANFLPSFPIKSSTANWSCNALSL
jgi:hypothetical protein